MNDAVENALCHGGIADSGYADSATGICEVIPVDRVWQRSSQISQKVARFAFADAMAQSSTTSTSYLLSRRSKLRYISSARAKARSRNNAAACVQNAEWPSRHALCASAHAR